MIIPQLLRFKTWCIDHIFYFFLIYTQLCLSQMFDQFSVKVWFVFWFDYLKYAVKWSAKEKHWYITAGKFIAILIQFSQFLLSNIILIQYMKISYKRNFVYLEKTFDVYNSLLIDLSVDAHLYQTINTNVEIVLQC